MEKGPGEWYIRTVGIVSRSQSKEDVKDSHVSNAYHVTVSGLGMD